MFLHRHIYIKASTSLVDPDIALSLKFDVEEDDQDLRATLFEKAVIFSSHLEAAFQNFIVEDRPVGDEPMVHIEIEYFHLEDDSNMVSTEFGVCSTETIRADAKKQACAKALSAALETFAGLMNNFLGGDE